MGDVATGIDVSVLVRVSWENGLGQPDHELFHGLVLAAKPLDLRRNFHLGCAFNVLATQPVNIRELRDIVCSSEARMCASSSDRQINSNP
jgi:hypothetical protein